MATPKSQRIAILVIAAVMLVGTIGSFAIMVLSNENYKNEAAKQMEDAKKQAEEEQKKTEELSSKYYPVFKVYENTPAEFDGKAVGEDVVKKDLVVGTGKEVTDATDYKAYYIGWNPKGKTFDSSFGDGALKAPLDTALIPGGLISGWEEGVIGMKEGGVRELTIPSDKAYGEMEQGADIPPNTPLKFIIMIIEVK